MIGAFSLKFQRDNQQNALAMDSTDGKTGEKAVFPQHGENTAFLSGFSADGLHNWGILLVIPLELQGIKHQPFPMTQPFVSYGEYTFWLCSILRLMIFFNENQEIKVRSTSGDVGLSHFLFIT